MTIHRNILEDLYYGKVSPWEKHRDRSAEYAKLVKTVSDNEKKLISSLNEEDQQLFSQLMKAEDEIACLSELEHFVDGFQLGAEFMLAAFLLP